MTARQQSSPFDQGPKRACGLNRCLQRFEKRPREHFLSMTRKRDRRSSPPSFGARKPPAAGADTKARTTNRLAPGGRPSERKEAKVSLIYGFHSVAAALKSPRRE